MLPARNLRAYLLETQEAKSVSLSGACHLTHITCVAPGPEAVRPVEVQAYSAASLTEKVPWAPTAGYSVSRLPRAQPLRRGGERSSNRVIVCSYGWTIFYEALRPTSARIPTFFIHVETIFIPGIQLSGPQNVPASGHCQQSGEREDVLLRQNPQRVGKVFPAGTGPGATSHRSNPRSFCNCGQNLSRPTGPESCT